MAVELETGEVWQEIERNFFAVLGMVTAKGESRTIGVNYVVDGRKLYIDTLKTSWKAKHVAANPSVSLTIPIAKRVPFVPWLKIPPATVSFSGEARVLEHSDVEAEVLQKLFSKVSLDQETMATLCVIEVTPKRDFITYGIGIPLMQMRFPDKARGRAAVAA